MCPNWIDYFVFVKFWSFFKESSPTYRILYALIGDRAFAVAEPSTLFSKVKINGEIWQILLQ